MHLTKWLNFGTSKRERSAGSSMGFRLIWSSSNQTRNYLARITEDYANRASIDLQQFLIETDALSKKQRAEIDSQCSADLQRIKLQSQCRIIEMIVSCLLAQAFPGQQQGALSAADIQAATFQSAKDIILKKRKSE